MAFHIRSLINHVHKTCHFEGDFKELNKISQKVLSFDLNEIAKSQLTTFTKYRPLGKP